MAAETDDDVVRLYCEAGWSYARLNWVKAVLNGRNVGPALASLMAAVRTRGVPRILAHVPGQGLGVAYGESFNFEDFAEALSGVLSLRVEVHDGKGAAREV